MNDNFSESYRRDEYSLFFIGGEYDEKYGTYVEGAIRSGRKKTHKLIGKVDPMENI